MAWRISVLHFTAQEGAERGLRVRVATRPSRDVVQASIVRLRATDLKQVDAASEVGVSTASVNTWSQRVERQGLERLVDRSGRGAKAAFPPAVVEEVGAKAGQGTPGMRPCSTRTTASEVCISASSVGRIWREHGLLPRL